MMDDDQKVDEEAEVKNPDQHEKPSGKKIVALFVIIIFFFGFFIFTASPNALSLEGFLMLLIPFSLLLLVFFCFFTSLYFF